MNDRNMTNHELVKVEYFFGEGGEYPTGYGVHPGQLIETIKQIRKNSASRLVADGTYLFKHINLQILKADEGHYERGDLGLRIIGESPGLLERAAGTFNLPFHESAATPYHPLA